MLRVGTGILSAVILVVLAAFALSNPSPVQASLFGRALVVDQWAIVVVCAALGLALGLLLAAPRLLAAGPLEREAATLRTHAADLEQRHAEMQHEYEVMQAERDLLNTRVGQLTRYAGTRVILGDFGAPPSTP